MVDEPTGKRAKLNNNDNDDLEELVHTVWEHYRNFLDSIDGDEEGGEGDIDELQELIEIAKDRIPKLFPLFGGDRNETGIDFIEVICPSWQSREKMLPILLSVAYYHLADDAISKYLIMQQQPQQVSSLPPSSESEIDESLDVTTAIENAKNLLIQSLEWYHCNAATWSMGANFGRMSQSLSLHASTKWYEMAVKTSTVLRERALESVEDESIGSKEKEWIELLVLNQIVGVQYETDDDEQENDENNQEIETTEDEKDSGGSDKEGQKNEEDCEEQDDTESDTGWYSSSSVEATARFMCAMLWSMGGRHDRALAHLKPFRLTHRLHPNIWKIGFSQEEKVTLPVALTESPLVFQPTGGIIPPHLYDAITNLFAPNAAYWKESGYSSRGYYSFFHEYDATKKQQPCNLIEEIIINHLMPRAQQCLNNMTTAKDDGKSNVDASTEKNICGFEWWAHTRPIKANLGHNLHFDTDESMLDQEGKVTHPILSSVLYLTGRDNGNSESATSSSPAGATIILDETPDSQNVGDYCWQGIPKDNTFLIFPGNRLHGVLPCPGSPTSEERESANATNMMDIERLIHGWKDHKAGESGSTPPSSSEGPPSRLTFMVGFWTRNVPTTMKHRSLYGPCGPLPPATEEHTWVRDIMRGYNNKTSEERPIADKIMVAMVPPRVSPAWELITTEKEEDMKEDGEAVCDKISYPIIPHGIDHRFFVQNAPSCFRESLFEDREIKH